jgi:hypothetical protein
MAKDSAVIWRQYRQLRFVWWAVLCCFGLSLFADDASIPLVVGGVWAIFSAAVAYWPCPVCKARVGYVGVGPFRLLWPFGGWCMACNSRLFLAKART